MRIAWVTDIHLDFLNEEDDITAFIDKIKTYDPDMLVITGDISTAPNLEYHLSLLRRRWGDLPLYFVLGNHDYYHGSFAAVHNVMYNQYSNNWLVAKPNGIKLNDTTLLLGHDGWYDGGYGNWFEPAVIMNDYFSIEDLLKKTGKRAAELKTIYTRNREWFFSLIEPLYYELQRLGQHAATFIENAVERNLEGNDKFVILTHIPPFPENAVHGPTPEIALPSNSVWLPNFTSKYMGDRLLAVAEKYPDKQFLVLCGHSHGKITTNPLPNLEVKTGFAKYGAPAMSIEIIEI